MPKISILLTCFNHMRYLPACLESIRSQTFQDFEVVAIDDGSTDGSRDLLAEEAKQNADRFHVIFNEKNLGTYGTLNVALESSKGDFVAILNDDDLWAPRKLEAQLELFERHSEVGLVHTDGHFIDGEGTRLEGSPLGFEFPRFETGQLLADLIFANKIIASAALVRRKCFDELGLFNPIYFGSGDWEMWMRIAEKYAIGFVPEPLTFYRVHGANASHKLERIWKDDEMLREWITGRAANYPKDALMLAALAHNQACLGTVKTLNGNPASGRQAYARSIKMQPGRLKSYVRWVATFLPRALFRKLL